MIARQFDRFAAALSWLSGVVAAAAVLGMLFHIGLEIVLRAVFVTSTFVLDEFVGYMVASMTFLGLAPTFRAHGHLRVTLLLDMLGPRARRLAEVVTLLCLVALATFIAWYFARAGLRLWRNGTVSQTVAEVPLWIPMSIVAIGCANLAIQVASQLALMMSGGRGDDALSESKRDG